MADNLETVLAGTDTAIPINAGVASVKTINHNPHTKAIIEKTGRYVGFPFLAKRTPVSGEVPAGSFFWNTFAMNKNDADFNVFISKNTQDGNYFNRILETAIKGDIIHYKDFRGLSTLLEFVSYTEQTDPLSNVYYDVTVKGFAENTNYAYQVADSLPCMVEIIKNTKLLDTRIISNNGYTRLGNVYTYNAGWQWLIKGANFVKLTTTPITVVNAAAGLQRIDYIVLDNTGNITHITGVEVVSSPASPTLTDNQILILFFTVTDAGISGETSTETMTDTTADHYKGDYDIVANTPALVNGTGQIGDHYKLTTGGSRDFGAGAITFGIGDVIKYSGAVWFKEVNNNQIDITANHFKGNWNASTNTPALANGVGQTGDEYRVSTAGTQFSIAFVAEDVIAYNGATWYKKVNNSQNIQLYKTIGGNVTLDNTYHGAITTITANATITVPTGLRADFVCEFDVIGAFTGTFAAGGGATVSAPFGLKVSNNNMCVLYTLTANNYRLNGNTNT